MAGWATWQKEKKIVRSSIIIAMVTIIIIIKISLKETKTTKSNKG